MAVEKGVLPRMAMAYLVIFSFTIPIFRSGGRTNLTFWEWVWNHTIWGPPIEYIPEEDYASELSLTGAAATRLLPAPDAEEVEKVMTYLRISEGSARRLLTNGPADLSLYHELSADVRWTGQYHPIKALVQPDDPQVKEVARILHQAPDFIEACQQFIHSFTTYKRERGDLWRTPSESLATRALDCDDKAILLCSLLRNYIPAEKVFCAVGLWDLGGHMWVVTEGVGGEDRIIEATAPPDRPLRGEYVLQAIFNDQYAFATSVGLKEFDLVPSENKEVVYA